MIQAADPLQAAEPQGRRFTAKKGHVFNTFLLYVTQNFRSPENMNSGVY